eukprot:TRINITY_DN1496_c0_g1_i23.p3 TRINITY_DN1496_c0_g1~~TRINITY_DN1496_c0_g1_i23.p3  ORF type:complete len:107 (-),score=31.88 TRINITY_DN1496_c0_g1_i23:103-423(-)
MNSNATEGGKEYLSKEVNNMHVHLTIKIKEDLGEDRLNEFKDLLGEHLEGNGGILYHIRPIRNKTIQLYVVARKDDFVQKDFLDWINEQLKENIEGAPSILALSKP